MRRLKAISVLILVAVTPAVAVAQDAVEVVESPIPLEAQIVTLVVTIFGIIAAVIPDEKMPSWLARIINFIALNVGKAKNAPGQ